MIEISQLSKDFGSFKAVKNLNLNLVEGEILGFLGPNGAGKSTTMKMLTGFLTPSHGSVKIFGNDLEADRVDAQKLIGYLPEGAPAYDEMTAYEYLGFIAEIRGFYGKEKQDRVLDVIEKMSLADVQHQKIETLSKGYKRRVGLAQAILHDPRVLILDEPTDGLDPNQKQQVRKLIRGLSKDKIVIISTHILEEVSAVCSRVIILSEGQKVVDCTPQELERKSTHYGKVRIEFSSDVDIEAQIITLESLDGVEKVLRCEEDDSSLLLCAKEGEALYPLLFSYFQDKTKPSPNAMYLEKGRLDEVFRELTLGDAA